MLTVTGCAQTKPRPAATVSASPTAPDVDAQAAAIAAKLSDVDAVGQMLVPFVYGQDATNVSAAAASENTAKYGVATPAAVIAKFRLGGLMLVRQASDDPTADTNPTSNVSSPAQIRRLTGGLQTAARKLPAGVPLLIATDQEHGSVTRIRNDVTLLPAQMAFGAARQPALTESAAAVSGQELRALGLNADFAPDADVTEGADNTVIGSRSFGSDPKLVGDQVAAAVRGYASAGIATTLKHFPGHGHTNVDSHEGLPILRQSEASLLANDIAPFQAGIAAGAPMVMSGHLDAEAIDPGTPATLSREVLTDLLRGKLGFKGVVITDSMTMPPVTRKYGEGEAAVRAVLAGNDMLLTPQNLGVAQQALLAAITSGRLPRAQVNASVARVIALKLREATAPQPALSTVDTADHQSTVDKAAAAAVTVYKGQCSGPLVRGPVAVTGGSSQTRDALRTALGAQGIRTSSSARTRIFLTGYGDTKADLRSAAVTVATDAPYLLASASSPTRIATYGTAPASMRALAAVLAGKAGAPGRSPVTVAGLPDTACR
ncbi:glycoside hydrolase family 3 protein [Fodinicola acaciae]|uniref:glycoside hydrolase family 3 protein n=1 Tax=Fodinicola acaciae TaxID=2681555 RepID=UPI001C9E9311|nr:glycoside hydrolase family 3 N-terminal domain-containing protein [Fodinicola acaciae]